MGINRRSSVETIWLKGGDSLGPLTLTEPADKRTCDLVRSTAALHPKWSPVRLYEELSLAGANLTEENVHWVMREYGLREYVTVRMR
jgi:hypothetical protein